MATCHGENSPYGCGHHAEHVAAAHKGWLTRHRRHALAGSRDFKHLTRLIGDVNDVHTHETHPHSVMLRRGRKWYELPHHEYRNLVRAGRDIERAEAAERRQEAAARRIIEQHRAAERRQAERDERHREAQDRQLRAMARAEYNEVARKVKSLGGIKHSAADKAEVQFSIPSSLRGRQGKGLSLDRMRESILEDMPWLNLETPNDVLDFFDRARTTRQQHAHAARVRRRAA